MSVLTVEAQQSVASPPATSRIEALDWTKGALVLCMVVYHAINYSIYRPMAFEFLAFLPSSFILIAGFLLGQVYGAKYDLATWKPYLRLMIRGGKLLLLFLVLNLGYCVLLEHSISDGIWEFGDRAGAIFLSGNGREAIFEVLLPIAYFLLLAPVLLWFRSRASSAIPFCAGTVFFLCVVLEKNGMSYKNLSLLSAGVVGMAFGLLPICSIDGFAQRLLPVLGVYVVYRLCGHFFGEIYAVQMFGALSSLTVLYGCARCLDSTSWSGRQIVLLGKYSLLGYLVQIALIQIIVRVSGGKPNHWIGVFAVTGAATVFLLLIVWGVHELRRWNRMLDGIYKAVFA
jgi:hypothetical protein